MALTQSAMSVKPSSSHGVLPPEGEFGVAGAESPPWLLTLANGVTLADPKLKLPIAEGVATEGVGEVGDVLSALASVDSVTALGVKDS
tara:strand:+ start:1200 stop:1463 length:264 start_codon:yes stop_codon:yes gene_type:complete